MRRLAGIDYGRKRLGVALTDPLGITVQSRPTLEVSGFADAVSQAASFAFSENAERIVLGLPLNMDGSSGDMAKEVERFGSALEAETGIPVCYWDERLTSEQAKSILKNAGKRHERGQVDQVAAALMLESYLRAHPAE